MRALAARTSALLVAGALACAAPAVAHDYPVGHTPGAGAKVPGQPGSVSVTFNDVVLTHPAAPDLVVTGPDGKHYETGCPSLVDHTVRVPASLGPDGTYTTTWRVVSSDGHPVSGTSTFTFTAGSGVHRASGQASGQSCHRGAQTSSGASSSASGASDTSDSSSSTGPLVAVGVALVGAVAGVTALLLRARRHPRVEEEIEDDE